MPTIRPIHETDAPAFRQALDSVARERLYEKLGFSEEGRKKKGRLAYGIYDDVILMGLLL